MELFGTVCAVIGAGTLSAGVMKIICWLDEGAKKRPYPEGSRVRSGCQESHSMRTSSVYTRFFTYARGNLMFFIKLPGRGDAYA